MHAKVFDDLEFESQVAALGNGIGPMPDGFSLPAIFCLKHQADEEQQIADDPPDRTSPPSPSLVRCPYSI
jgi:hypothetical protein